MTKALIYLPMTYPTVSTRFMKSFLDLTHHKIDGVEISYHISNTFPLDRNRNQIVQIARSKPYFADYVLFVDGDNLLPKDTLKTLLEHASDEYPVVAGLYWRKKPPFRAVAGHYVPTEEKKNILKTLESMCFVDKDGQQCAFYKPVTDFDTVQRIDVTGCGCLLVRMDVFDKIELPYFGYFNAESLGGDYSVEHLSEDMLFFRKLRGAGIKTLLVPQVRCGHIVERVIGCNEEQ